MMNRYILLLISLILNLNNTQSAFATESDPLAALKKEYLKQNSVDAQVAAYDALYALPENEIASRTDVFSKKILGYIDIAAEGIRYVQHHYRDNSVVLGSCESLHAELMVKAAEGLTPVEFILFNMKLALIQEHYLPGCYPLDFDQTTQILLQNGLWKTTPFYEFEMPADSESDPYSEMSQPHLIFQLKASLLSLFEEGYEDFSFKPYIIYNPNGGFKTSRITKNIVRPDGKNRTLCALPIGTVSVKNSPHGIHNRTPFVFLTHDLGHARSVWWKLSREPEQYFSTLNVQKFIRFIQPIIDGINEHRISDTIIENFLFLLFYESVYTQPVFGVDASSLKSIFISLENKYNSTPTNEDKKNIMSEFFPWGDPFVDILNAYGRKVGHYYSSNYFKGDPSGNITVPSAYNYTGTRNIQLNGKTASFTCTAKRTGEISEISPWHEYAEVTDITYVPGDDTNPLESINISQILSLNETRHVVPTLAGFATSYQSELKVMLPTLGKSSSISFDTEEVLNGSLFDEAARELLYAFKAKVEEIMPGALA